MILTTRKSLLTLNNSTWTKCHNDEFDVSMGVYDSAQVADLVCFYILDVLYKTPTILITVLTTPMQS